MLRQPKIARGKRGRPATGWTRKPKFMLISGGMSLAMVATAFFVEEGAPHLLMALTHPSFSNEMRDGVNNQRLEFLGDAVLELCVTDWLFRSYPEADEGELTRRRAQVVNADALAEFARQVGVDHVLRLGRGAEANGLRQSKNVLADAVEALIACAYLDGGLPAARSACEAIVQHSLDVLDQSDPKSELQERLQGQKLGAPIYKVVATGGPAHEKWFAIEVVVAGATLGAGKGRSKRDAERAAAREALQVDWGSVPNIGSGATE
jgi:ribonuclease III